MPNRERRLPIKVVIPQDTDLRFPHSGGSRRKIFPDAVNRNLLLEQLADVRRHFAGILSKQPNLPAVARVVLRDDALAKSHRPQRLFSQNTCPIIGGETFGHLLVRVSAAGLGRLERDIGRNSADVISADLSTVNRIEAYTAEDAAGHLGIAGLSRAVVDVKNEGIKFRLFEHRNSKMNHAVREAFFELVHSLKLPDPEPLPYISGLRIYRVCGVTRQMVSRLAGFVGTQSVELFAQFELFAQYIPQGDATAKRFPGPEPGRQYPVVGLIDSGTDPGNSFLQAWVVSRDEGDVPRADQDNNHGSFVAGLTINGRGLNHGDHRFPASQSRIVDVVGIPKPSTPVTETDLLETTRRVVKKYPDVKVWNLSVSRKDMVCRDDGFSDFGIELDAIQRQYDVTFVVCAGNYERQPLRGWPPEDLGEHDRLHPPGDTALGITVGSLAHVDRPDTRVRREEPSPFTRRGPGAAFLPKPEVCHYGGNCSSDLNCHQVGVVSLDGTGHIAEAIGTSFSTPLISTLLANIRAGIVDPISRNLSKALLVQSAALRGQPIVPSHLRYRGFGVPSEVEEILTCAPWQATMILEPLIDPRKRIFARADFPIPRCFRLLDGRVEGEFLLTLVYDPPLDAAAGAEYCQVNVDVSLGTYDADQSGKAEHRGLIPLDPSPSDLTKLYERNLVEYGFKWSPVKVYRKRLERTSGQRWQIQMRLLHRAGLAVADPQSVALIVTLFDPKHMKPVYNDVVTAMARSGWVTQDLRVDERIRAQLRA
jgi:serine protease AprX